MRVIARVAIVAVAVVALSGCVSSRRIVSGEVTSTGTENAIKVPGTDGTSGFGAYSIGPDDVLAVRVFREPDLSYESVRVDSEGRFEMPLIGRVEAAGKSPDELSREIARRYGSNYLVNPQIAVNVLQANSKRLTIEGAVDKPGLFTMATPTDLLSAVAMAGGPTDTAKLKEIAVFRTIDGKKMVAAFDLTRVRSGEMENPVILPGDTVVVGFSSLRSGLQDALKAAPLLAIFRIF
jgi:polysaccharide biosynthesis/export protein